MKTKVLSRLFRFGKASFSRSHERHQCQFAGTMFFLERGFTIDGYVMEISLGGVLFRPSQTYLVRRHEGTVRITAGPLVAEAELRNTSALGYGLQLRQPLAREQLEHFIQKDADNHPSNVEEFGQVKHG